MQPACARTVEYGIPHLLSGKGHAAVNPLENIELRSWGCALVENVKRQLRIFHTLLEIYWKLRESFSI